MQKILITLTQAVTVKNLMRTGVVEQLLKDPTIELIFLTQHPERIEYYQKEFAFPRTSYRALASLPSGAWERLFSFLKVYTIRTKTTDLRRSMVAHDTGRYGNYLAGTLLNRLVAHRLARVLIRALDVRLVHDAAAKKFLAKETPDLVVLTNLFEDFEISLLREARRLGIRTVGLINSWDRLTARWSVRLRPDTLLVFNEENKGEAVRLMDMPAHAIQICGIPQYDRYVNETPIDRETFFRSKGLDPHKRLILLAPMGPTFSDSDWQLIDLIERLMHESKELQDCQMLVRFQPNEALDRAGILERPWLIYDDPGIRFGEGRSGDWDMTEADLRGLHASLHYADVLITYTSSISVDAAVTDTPIININFTLHPVHEYLRTPTFYYGTNHHQSATRTGGIHIVKSVDELVHATRAYLDNPSLDHAQRHRLAEEQTYRLDGKSSARIAAAIRAAVPHRQP